MRLPARNSGLFPLGAPAGFASGDAPSTRQDADGRVTDPRKLSARARTSGTLGDASINAPAAALSWINGATLSPHPFT